MERSSWTRLQSCVPSAGEQRGVLPFLKSWQALLTLTPVVEVLSRRLPGVFIETAGVEVWEFCALMPDVIECLSRGLGGFARNAGAEEPSPDAELRPDMAC